MPNKTLSLIVFLSLALSQTFCLARDLSQENAQENKQEPTVQTHYPNIIINGNEEGWKSLSLSDFENVNCQDDTWNEENGVIKCKGNCVGVIRSKEQYKNLELLLQWSLL